MRRAISPGGCCCRREVARTALADHIDADRLVPATVDVFLARLDYVPLDATDPDVFGALAATVKGEGEPKTELSIFLSTAPSLFGATIAGLAAAGLTGEHVRLALEKPLRTSLPCSPHILSATLVALLSARKAWMLNWSGTRAVPR